MQTAFARYFYFRKIDMFFAMLKTRYDINLVAVRQHIESFMTCRVRQHISKNLHEIYIDDFIFDEIIITQKHKIFNTAGKNNVCRDYKEKSLKNY